MSHNTPAVRVRGLSKRYRIGAAEERHATMVAAFGAALKAPFTNWRNVRDLTRFGAEDEANLVWALKDVSFDVDEGEVVGIIGRNGAGKSTLLKILCRITDPTAGRAEIFGRIGSLLEVGTGFHPDLTGRENVYINGTILGMKKREIDERFEEIVEFAEVARFIDTPVKRYSTGMRVRLAFSVAAHLQPEILIVDEVLAVGDLEFQRKCIGKMGDVARQGRTVLFVSHNMEAVTMLCSRCLLLDGGEVAFSGLTQDAVDCYSRGVTTLTGSESAHSFRPTTPISGIAGITEIEVLDPGGQRKAQTATWDDLCFRIHYSTREDIAKGSIILEIRDLRDQRLIVLDSGLRFPLRQGRHVVDCHLGQLPLSAGEYVLGAGLAVSNSEWLWRDTHLGLLRVMGKDVFDLGRPPSYARSVLALAHQWREA